MVKNLFTSSSIIDDETEQLLKEMKSPVFAPSESFEIGEEYEITGFSIKEWERGNWISCTYKTKDGKTFDGSIKPIIGTGKVGAGTAIEVFKQLLTFCGYKIIATKMKTETHYDKEGKSFTVKIFTAHFVEAKKNNK